LPERREGNVSDWGMECCKNFEISGFRDFEISLNAKSGLNPKIAKSLNQKFLKAKRLFQKNSLLFT
jgi:hypothetical protein